MASTQNRAPTGDGTVTGTVTGSAGTRYTLVDDYPSTDAADMLTFGTVASAINFTYSVFTVPVGSTALSVQVRYADGEASNGSNNCGGRIIVNGANQNAATHNPSTTATLRSDNWATNPVTASAWTVDQVNGTGGNALSGFGINSSDSNPTFNVRSIEVQVTFDAPITADSTPTLGTLTVSSGGTLAWPAITGTAAATLGAVTSSSNGALVWPEITATTAATLGVLSVSSDSNLTWAEITATVGSVLADVVTASEGTLSWPEITSVVDAALEAVTTASDGTVTWVPLTGDTSATLAALGLTSTATLVNSEITGTTDVTLANLTFTSNAGVFWEILADLSSPLESLTLASNATYGIPRERLARLFALSGLQNSSRRPRTRF